MNFLTGLFLFLAALPLNAAAGALAEEVIAELNLARTAPQHYAQILAAQSDGGRSAKEAIRFLEKQRPLPALATSEGLRGCAFSHVLDKGRRGALGHRSSNLRQPWDRMALFGRRIGHAGENIDYGVRAARAIVLRWIVDEGVPSRGHRKNIFSRDFRVAGAATGYHATYGAMCVIDFAGDFIENSGALASRSGPLIAPL